MQNYPNLFSPITIGETTFKNRIWSAPASCHLLASGHGPNDDVIAYYAAKARGGAACLIYSAQNMDTERPQDPSHSEETILDPGTWSQWRRLTDAVHYYNGKIGLELLEFHHHGYDETGRLVSYSVNGRRVVTAETVDDDGQAQPPLPLGEMEKLAERYADAA